MNLIHIQRQGIEASTKNAASYRFIAKADNFTKSSDLVKEREQFDANNFRSSGGGLLLFPYTYTDIKQLEQQTYAVDAKQIELIQTNVYNYFGVNQKILQGSCYGDEFSAWYESVIEPFAIQLSEVLTKMCFSGKKNESAIFYFTSNRIQFMTNADKLNVSKDMIDRGMLSINEAREIWNMPLIDEEWANKHVIRGEYYDTRDKLENDTLTEIVVED